MTQTTNRFFDEMARLMNDAAGAAEGARREIETVMRAQAERILRNMDVVTREEFAVVQEMAANAREENERLAVRVAGLEKKLETESPQCSAGSVTPKKRCPSLWTGRSGAVALAAKSDSLDRSGTAVDSFRLPARGSHVIHRIRGRAPGEPCGPRRAPCRTQRLELRAAGGPRDHAVDRWTVGRLPHLLPVDGRARSAASRLRLRPQGAR